MLYVWCSFGYKVVIIFFQLVFIFMLFVLAIMEYYVYLLFVLGIVIGVYVL